MKVELKVGKTGEMMVEQMVEKKVVSRVEKKGKTLAVL